ncbi:hypothetical protein SBA6_510015 [Candidatus Sulfopaludibacter sp. SbA6]|nr:hypothetical protein SBA6_510015 [Candidatus Sulfopaludibacter sp. SbA6]
MGETFLRVFGDGTDADAEMLDAIRDEHRLHFLVFRVPKPKST